MKANFFMILIILLIAAVLGYWVSYVEVDGSKSLLAGITSGVCFAATLIPAYALQYESGRLGVNIRVLSTLFFVAFLVSHFWFAKTGSVMPTYVIVNGLLLLVFLGIFYKMNSIKDV